MFRAAAVLVALILGTSLGLGHHGGGTFDSSRAVTRTGKLTKIDFINPHSWIYFDVVEDGKMVHHRCETRSAHTLRRSGWTPEMFKIGQPITIEGSPDRNDPQSCYLSTIILADGSRMDRYGQFVSPKAAAATAKARSRTFKRLPSGEPDISGDWAPEQLVMTDPRGRGGALVPLSTVGNFKPGEGRIGGGATRGGGAGRGGPRLYGGTELTELGTLQAAKFGTYSVTDNPRMRCETTSVIFDWTFDGPVNRIIQNGRTIEILYGQMNLKRTIHLNMKAHPATIKPTRAGHSIGRWEKDVLVVDTVGFLPGVLSPPVLHSDKLHIVERFSLDPKTMALTRNYSAEDPVYVKGQYVGLDVVTIADAAYTPDTCAELGFVDYSKEHVQAGTKK
jgi:hypothetical protein